MLHHVELVAHAPVAGDHQGAAVARDDRHGSDGHLNQAIQGVEFPLDAAAASDVNHRKARSVQNVASDNHVGAAEGDETVAIRVRRGWWRASIPRH